MLKRYTGKITAVLLAVCLTFSLTGCGTEVDTENDTRAEMSELKPGTQGAGSTEEDENTGDKTTGYSDGIDYDQYIDNAPNTAQPREYAEDEIEIDITEALYASYIDDIYVNAEKYIGSMIRIEGMYLGETYEGKNYYYVYREGPGHVLDHDHGGELMGFEFTYNGDMPENGDWIEVVGTLRQYMEGQIAYLTLDAVSVTVKPDRGSEQVTY